MNPDDEVVYIEYQKKTELVYDFTLNGFLPEGAMPFQDCGYPYYENGIRKVHEEVVLLVRDSSRLWKDQIQFMQIQIEEVQDDLPE